MICSKDEFLLHLSNWMTASQSVVVTILLDHQTGSSSVTIGRFRGFVQYADPEFFVIGRKGIIGSASDTATDDFIKVSLEDWEFSYADPLERPAMTDGLIGIAGSVIEGLSLTKSPNIQISVFALG